MDPYTFRRKLAEMRRNLEELERAADAHREEPAAVPVILYRPDDVHRESCRCVRCLVGELLQASMERGSLIIRDGDAWLNGPGGPPPDPPA